MGNEPAFASSFHKRGFKRSIWVDWSLVAAVAGMFLGPSLAVAGHTFHPAFIQARQGISLDKNNYLLPLSWAERYKGRHAEVIFQLSGKVQLFDTGIYFAYTQRSFWQAYNRRDSSPLRETDYAPRIFYRATPRRLGLFGWGVDAGAEHQSNGRSGLASRSWNRIYVAPYWPRANDVFYLEFWYRLPERAKRYPLDVGGDDNPDITDYLGYGEIHYIRRIFGRQRLHLMLRGNPATGRGAVRISYSVPTGAKDLYFRFTFFNGFGESLIDYNRSVTRVGAGIAILQ